HGRSRQFRSRGLCAGRARPRPRSESRDLARPGRGPDDDLQIFLFGVLPGGNDFRPRAVALSGPPRVSCAPVPSVAPLSLLQLCGFAWFSLAALIGFFVVWAAYRFSFGKTVWTSFPLPFPELYSGIKEVAHHNDTGHLSYFMGEVGWRGWWAFFPVLIAVKLP